MGDGGLEGPPPPRTLDVQEFAAARSREVHALYDALKARLKGSSAEHSSVITARHLRRRTTSHNRRLPFRWKRQNDAARRKGDEWCPSVGQSHVTPASEESCSSRKRNDEARLPSRRVRRRTEFRGVREGTRTCARDGTRRLATHVWHAKRFPMTRVWGHCLPLGLPGRGRGSKGFFKWMRDAAVLHDASYIGLIQLQGTAGAILQILRKVLEPRPRVSASGPRVEDEEMRGLLYSNAVFHNVGKSPLEAIVPVTILWRPTAGSEKGNLELSPSQQVEERQLWIWMHPSAFDCVLQILSELCEIQGRNNSQDAVQCASRRGELARFDLLGSKASQVLRKVLRPVPRSFQGLKDGAQSIGREPITEMLLSNADRLPGAAVLALDVFDPRDSLLSCSSAHGATPFQRAQNGVVNSDGLGDIKWTMNSTEDRKGVYSREDPVLRSEDAPAICWEALIEKDLTRDVADSPYLWSPPTDHKVTAISQKAMSHRRHVCRQANVREKGIVYSRWDSSAPGGVVEQGAACPVVLLKQANSKLSTSGWSIIIPTTWVQAFWVPLVYAGGHVIGLRERQWLATDAGNSYFPDDFPDCVAHMQQLDTECRAFEAENLKRPPYKRALPFAMPALQLSALSAYRSKLSISGQCRFCGVSCPQLIKPDFKTATPGDHPELGWTKNSSTASETGAGLVSPVPDWKSYFGGFDDGFGTFSSDPCHVSARSTTPLNSQAPESDFREAGLHRLPWLVSADRGRILDRPNSICAIETFRSAVAFTDPRVSPMISNIVNDAGNSNSIKNTINDSTGIGFLQDGEQSSPLCSLSQQAHSWKADQCNSHKESLAKEMTIMEPMETNTLQHVKNLAKNIRAVSEPPGHVPFGCALQNACCVQHGDMRLSTNLPKQKQAFFVARTMDALTGALKGSGLQNTLFRPYSTCQGKARIRLTRGTLGWRPCRVPVTSTVEVGASDILAPVNSQKATCHVRVLIRVPRKGVLRERGVLCAPTMGDVNAFLNRSQRWQGVETSGRPELPKSRTHQSQKTVPTGNAVGLVIDADTFASGFPNLDSEKLANFCSRKVLGCITSVGPPGSMWQGTGICEVDSLLNLRAMQWSDQRWWISREILLLSGNVQSRVLRPVLVSIALEIGQDVTG